MSSNGGKVVSAENTEVSCPTCVRCKDLITSGHAYELGDDRWHTQCFSCYRCEKPLTCDSDFLVLGTGTLICFDCSDCCKSCGKKIDDLAIILSSSNEAYCSECFKCCKCGDNITDLRYAKTKRGLFCIHCHERLLAKRKYYEEKKRRLKKDLPDVPTVELSTPLVIPEKSPRRPTSPVRGQSLGQSSLSPPKSMIKSNSESVISQYFNDNEDVEAFEGSEEDKEQRDDRREVKHSRNVSIDDILNSTLENDEDSMRAVQETKILLDKTPLRNHKTTESGTKSPVTHRQGMILETPDSTPIDIAEGVENTLRGFGEKLAEGSIKNDALAFSEAENDSPGLAITLPSSELLSKSKNEEDTLTLGFEDNTPTTSNLTSPYSSPSPSKPEGPESKSISSKSINSPGAPSMLPPDDSIGIHEANGTNGKTGRKISRSLSLKSKTLVHSLKSRTTGILDPRSSSPSNSRSREGSSSLIGSGSTANKSSPSLESDTHSGWGVATVHENSVSPISVASSRHRTTPRGKSDSVMSSEQRFSHKTGKRSITDSLDHRRTHSNASVSSAVTNVSMFRTPPLENSSVFARLTNSGSISHHRTISWQAHNGAVPEESGVLDALDDKEATTYDRDGESSFKQELDETELLLRKLKSEVNELESKRAHLVNEIDGLQSSKNKLCHELERLREEKSKYSSVESFNPSQSTNDALRSQEIVSDGSPSVKQTETVSVARPANKPRFWKIFSGTRQQASQNQQQMPQGSSGSTSLVPDVVSSSSFSNSNNVGGSRPEISGPVLQNPNEFNDMKLVPISNNSRSEMSIQTTSSRLEGSVLYGSSLVARCAYEQSTIPVLVRTCVEHIEHGDDLLTAEGIYRKSGSQLLIEEIERAFADCEAGPSDKVLGLLDEDVHAVASVLKRYLRKLPNPVLTFQVYEPLINVVRENRLMVNVPLKAMSESGLKDPQYLAALNVIGKILDNLPKEHLDLLQYLAEHVDAVTSYSESNLMTLHNLSLVFAPGLIRDYSGEKDITDMSERNYLVGFIFGHYRDIFNVE